LLVATVFDGFLVEVLILELGQELGWNVKIIEIHHMQS
jgi:hypothetical protein